MASDFKVFIGHDDREAIASHVCEHSIRKRTKSAVSIKQLDHRELRERGLFKRPWSITAASGGYVDQLDEKPFSTQFSHTRFLIPALMSYKGWALFMDSDMIFLNDISKLFALADDKYAVMCVKHNHVPLAGATKMDKREQLRYHRKNWSSFVLWNCGHPSNAGITPEAVNFMSGSELHSFSWLKEKEIGSLPFSYNYIVGVSPNCANPDVVHYTEGGPWFKECTAVPLAQLWEDEHEDYLGYVK